LNSIIPLNFPGTLKVTVLPPVSTIGLTSDDVGDLTEKVRQQMLEVYHEGSKANVINDDLKLKHKSE
jgi:lysophosphatidate acyltransferase